MAKLKTKPQTTNQTSRESDSAAGAVMRVDSAHQSSTATLEAAPSDAAPVSLDEESHLDAVEVIEPIVAARLRVQASQLAGHLQERRRELDRREAELNARLFQLEAESRAAKLWLREKRHELDQQTEELRTASADVKRQAAGMSAAEMAADDDFHARRQDLDRRTSELELRETQLQAREAELARRIQSAAADERAAAQQRVQVERNEAAALQRIAAAREAAQTQQRQMLRQLEIRRAALEQADATPKQATERPATMAKTSQPAAVAADSTRNKNREKQLQRQWQDLCAEREALRRRSDEERLALAKREKHFAEQVARQRAELDKRRENLHQRAAAHDRLHNEILHKHREALELRIVAEQLWAQLGKSVTPQTTNTFAELRSELTAAYREETAQATDQRRQVRALADALEAQDQELRRKRRELERWAARTRDEIEEQAARLVARERQLDRREAELTAEFALASN